MFAPTFRSPLCPPDDDDDYDDCPEEDCTKHIWIAVSAAAATAVATKITEWILEEIKGKPRGD